MVFECVPREITHGGREADLLISNLFNDAVNKK